MIPVERLPPTERLTRLCANGTERIHRDGVTPTVADKQWNGAEAAKGEIRSLLERMASERVRCMYCLDSFGSDIDHFVPRAHQPLLTFAWPNLLLACSTCNSKYKRDLYPCDETTGECLLIDPTVDNPADHLRFLLGEGIIEGKTPKGWITIETLRLDRSELRKGRKAIYRSCRLWLVDWHRYLLAGDLDAAAERADALRSDELGHVLNALVELSRRPHAALALRDSALVKALSAWLSLPDDQGAIPPARTGSFTALPVRPT
jgi:uncharacterized protein (TIGR02646 family)